MKNEVTPECQKFTGLFIVYSPGLYMLTILSKCLQRSQTNYTAYIYALSPLYCLSS